ELSDAALTQASPLFRGESGTFCAGRNQLYALHLADPAVSGFDCASRVEGCAAERERRGIAPGRTAGGRYPHSRDGIGGHGFALVQEASAGDRCKGTGARWADFGGGVAFYCRGIESL